VLAIVFSACGGNGHTDGSPAASGQTVPFTVVARAGPPIGGAAQSRNDIYLFAAPSVQDLTGLIYASGDTLGSGFCSRTPVPPECWAGAPARSLLIATFVAHGCGLQSDITDARLSNGSTLTLSAVTKPTSCPIPGSGTQPATPFWLVAVPLDKLPGAVLTVTVHGIAQDGATFRTPDLVTTVDLRTPFDIKPTMDARMTEATKALADVTTLARARIGPGVVPTDLAIRSWNDDAMTCGQLGPSALPHPITGYVIQMGTSSSGSLGEYHWSAGRIVSC
jgi:hypothetical protein